MRVMRPPPAPPGPAAPPAPAAAPAPCPALPMPRNFLLNFIRFAALTVMEIQNQVMLPPTPGSGSESRRPCRARPRPAYEHPRDAGPFVGPQLRYLAGSAHGRPGGLGFRRGRAAPAARDARIGWDKRRRSARLHRLPGLCRLPGRPGISCRNLASRVPGRVVRAVAGDFERLHGYRPWLPETFVGKAEPAAAGRQDGGRRGRSVV